MTELLKNLAAAKKEIGAISKTEENPFFKSKYFDINKLLEHVEPILEKHGLMVIQPIADGKVTTQIVHPESGDMLGSEMELPSIADPQKMGSAVTYYRRYTLQSLLALQAEDDDGNTASKAATEKPELYPRHSHWNKIIEKLESGVTIDQVKEHYSLSSQNEAILLNESNYSEIQRGDNYNQTDIKKELKK